MVRFVGFPFSYEGASILRKDSIQTVRNVRSHLKFTHTSTRKHHWRETFWGHSKSPLHNPSCLRPLAGDNHPHFCYHRIAPRPRTSCTRYHTLSIVTGFFHPALPAPVLRCGTQGLACARQLIYPSHTPAQPRAAEVAAMLFQPPVLFTAKVTFPCMDVLNVL